MPRPSRAPHRSWLLTGLVLVPCLSACDGSGTRLPQSPAPVAEPRGLAAGTTLSVISGEDGHPVAAARMVVAGRTYDTDAAGEVRLADPAELGSLVDVVAGGFLDRQTLVRGDGATRLVLWPRQTKSGISETYTAQIVYTTGSREAPPQGSSPLLRLRRGTTQVAVVASEEIRANEGAYAAHEAAVAEVNAAVGGRVSYRLTETRPASGVVIETRVDPADANCTERTLAYFAGTAVSGEITSGRIVFCQTDAVRPDVVTHELGHSLGLQHPSGTTDLMDPFSWPGKRASFSERETTTIGLLFERPGGNRFPDSDRDVSAAATGTITIHCP